MAEPVGELPARVSAVLRGAARPVCAYVYDRAVLRTRAAALRAAVVPARLYYAVKANGHPAVVGAFAAATDGLEVASGGELDLAVAAGARTIAFSGPAKTDAELRAAVRAGAVVHVESMLELHRLAEAARAETARSGGGSARAVRAAVRVNRAGGGLPGTHQMAGAATQFGVDKAELPAVLAAVPSTVELLGFHLHAVSNNLDAAAHAAFAREAAGWAHATATAHGLHLRYLNLGGGLGVDYTGAAEFDVAVLSGGLRDAAAVLPVGAVLALEPGRYLAAAGGWYAAEVLDLKRTHGRWFAVLRGGTHHFRLPAAWGYSHPFAVLPVEDWPYPYPRPELRDATVDVAGELCTPRDVLARDAKVTRVRVGDVLVFGRAGAYGWDISHHDFLRHPYPQMLIV